MVVASLTRGVKAGILAGVVFALFMAVVANPLLGYADGVAHGDSHHAGEGNHDDSASPVSTDVVSVVSAGLWAVLLGGSVFGLGFFILEPAIPGTGATKSYLLGVAGFVTVSGAPWLALPPVTPGTEYVLSTTTRLLVYGGMMVAGALTSFLAGVVYNRLRDTHGRVGATLAAVSTAGLLVVPATLAPGGTTSGSLPASLGAGLTGLVVFGQVLLWALLATAHAQLGSHTSPDDDLTTTESSLVSD